MFAEQMVFFSKLHLSFTFDFRRISSTLFELLVLLIYFDKILIIREYCLVSLSVV